MIARRLMGNGMTVQPHIAALPGLRPFSGTGWFSAPAYRPFAGGVGLLIEAADARIGRQSHERESSP